jgi:uncharacterized protein (DUF608 family)
MVNRKMRRGLLLSAMLILAAGATRSAGDEPYRVETFTFPDAPHRVAGVKYRAGDARSAVPLGGLGTGTAAFDSQGRFTGQALANSYRPVGGVMPDCGFTVRVESDGQVSEEPLSKWARSYLGHFPIVDLEAGDAAVPVSLQLRALSPFIPGDARASATPAALFRFLAHNRGDKPAQVSVRFRWDTPVADRGIGAQGNVDGFLMWKLGDLAPDACVTVAVKCAAAGSLADLKAHLQAPRDKVRMDDDGAFNWEDRHQQDLDGSLSQHGFYLHYQDGAAKRAGTRVVGRDRLENLVRADRGGDAVRLKTTDNALAIQVRPLGGALEYEIANTGGQPVRDVQLAVYANLEAGHTEADDRGTLDPGLGALLVTDGTGAACALAGDRAPDAGWCGVWPQTLGRLRDGQAVALAEWRRAGETTAQRRGGVALVTQEDPRSHAGCTLVAFDGEAVPAEMAVAAGASLRPDETRELRFVLAWFYPDARDSAGRFVGHQYANWFDGSAAVANHVAQNWDDLTQRVGAWQESIYDDAQLPDWLKDQLVNSLYSLARNTAWLKDGRFTHSESYIGCPITETIVCRFYGSIPLAMLFPELEMNAMRQFIRHQRADGAIAFAFGPGENWDAPYYGTQRILNSSEFVLMAWRDYAWWKDKGWADEVYPAVKKAVAYARTLDGDGDGLIDDDLSLQYYDCWQFHGASAYTGGIWLAALRAAVAFAELQQDEGFRAECAALLKKALASFEEKLWTGSYYRLWNDPAKERRSDTCLAAQLTGQWYAYLCGLGEVLPGEHIRAALEHICAANGASAVWALVNGIAPDGTRDRSAGCNHSHTATLGETWCYAATCLYAGRPDWGLPRAARLAENIALRQRRLWNTTWNMDPDTGEMLWGAEYYSNLCVWDLFGALTGRRTLPGNHIKTPDRNRTE